MKKISTRNYKKHYILHLLPTVSKTGETAYVATAEEAKQWYKWLQLLIKGLISDPKMAKNMMLRADQLLKYGGVVASLQTVVLPLAETDFTNKLVYLDLNYAVNKEVEFFLGGINVTPPVATSDKMTGLVTRFLKELYAGHEEIFSDSSKDLFIEELFMVDDVDVVLAADSTFKVQVDRSLRDYIMALNSRLRVNA